MENINYERLLDIDGYYKENLELIESLKNNRQNIGEIELQGVFNQTFKYRKQPDKVGTGATVNHS
ncbi:MULTISPECIES: hypothetical protein [unclassified Synechocystis]|jgi:hypothetical protein|uniref:hypothetical protein n=1 Tax=unclassified Synechocystis TaxID=2640012 RepID=UPI0002A57EB2|nr:MULTISPECIES: hypothetical protein [unclassified Synechocystis]BAM53743.1 hypothetical protein BEST7613_4812 [Synechocystis sp. PCC 6803] [Bacillus subtilis BEST7613]ALJ68845.1 hypothetical protein AOY38_13990 [Synechocystis sp. PCC 6803]AVP90707.1 hypothetical protein C7I86_14110 [Synechocystis sp. IPPAS B-1465]MBD2618835.1 hypothetical protein [Synechocystis sp. FACHB-898]MBD2640640.1 hypothetical protein [Synechocystis sp. FACHB-908]